MFSNVRNFIDFVIYHLSTISVYEGQLGAFQVDAIQTPTPLRGGSSIPLRFDPFSFGKRHYNFLDIQKGFLSYFNVIKMQSMGHNKVISLSRAGCIFICIYSLNR